ncbi:MAG: BPTI/Kunitz domain-containing protein [Bacteroidales bacterium]|nr:BPTI/Kunitz domain-containing protein [Bacteroidales bacterium]
MKPSFIKTSAVLFIIASISIFSACKCCSKKKTLSQEEQDCQNKCALVPDPGNCKAYFPRYYFDKESGTCKEFIWGGCDGVVPFNTLEECQNCDCKNE